jgi:hypothetical protein
MIVKFPSIYLRRILILGVQLIVAGFILPALLKLCRRTIISWSRHQYMNQKIAWNAYSDYGVPDADDVQESTLVHDNLR